VAEPFGYAPPLRLPIADILGPTAIPHRRDRLERVAASERTAHLAEAGPVPYDVLVCALGAEPRAWLPGALTFAGPDAVADVRGLLDRLASGAISRVVFAAPPGAAWTLPLYELALLTAAWTAEQGVHEAELSVVTPEPRPLDLFGEGASLAVRDVLADRGVTLVRGTHAEAFEDGGLRLAGGRTLAADAVLTLPRLHGRPVPGLPADAEGFIPVDPQGGVAGTEGVYAVGDGTAYPLKQGGVAAQQADTAAAAIAHGFGAAIEVPPFDPVVRALLFTGVSSAYLRAGPADDSAVSFRALWWPPTKVAGHYLGPVLAGLHEVGRPAQLTDRPLPEEAGHAAEDRREMRRLALEMAEADAGWGDYRSALRWLQTVEWLDGILPADLAAKRERWQAAVAR
jgi:sulfide:quinone oxidoreductase